MDSLFRRAGNLSSSISQTTEFTDVLDTAGAAERPIFEQIPCYFPVPASWTAPAAMRPAGGSRRMDGLAPLR
jgi:hypothetical protein